MGEHGVVPRLVEPRPRQGEPRREGAVAVAQLDEGAHLVQGEELADPVAQLRGDEARIGGEGLGGVARFPAAAILQRLRQVPVIERGEGHDAVGQQLVDQPVVEGEALRVGRPAPLRKTGAARRSRSGRSRRPAPSSAPRPPCSDDSDRRRCRRSRRRGSCRAAGRRCPRWNRPARLPAWRPRSDRPTWPFPSGSRGKSRVRLKLVGLARPPSTP